jgi:hypothetical protein
MATKRRVVFTFDERSLSSLEEITQKARFSSLGDTVKESLQVSRAIQQQAEDGFTEVVVRNPKTGKEKVILVPNLTSPIREPRE